MMPRKIWISLLTLPWLLTVSLNGCASSVSEETTTSSSSATLNAHSPRDMATTAVNAFTANLYTQLSSQPGNLFLSPYSVSTALTMAYLGAENNTKTQMIHVLQLGGEPPTILRGLRELQRSFVVRDARYELNFTNDLWVQKEIPLTKHFKEQLHDTYNATEKPVDFAKVPEDTRTYINQEIAQQTNQKIKELLGQGTVTPETRLILTNAIYFKGQWRTLFDPKNTEEAEFTKLDNTPVKVPMMYQKNQFRYLQDDDAQLIELPYQSSQQDAGLSMVILLPRNNLDFKRIEGKLPHYLQQKNDDQPLEIGVFLPKFKLESTFQLRDPLKNMGMDDAFNLAKADFSGMTEEKGFAISEVIHKAFVEVNEEGTEATAATAVITARGMTPIFRVNHPFIFWIKDNLSGTILFLGRVVDPSFK